MMHPTSGMPVTTTPLNLVGGNHYGRYPKISDETTFNMLISDGWLIGTPGYKRVIQLLSQGNGRHIYTSVRGGFMVAVIDNVVYKIMGPLGALSIQPIFTIETVFGDVFIDENIANQIAICDGQDLWIWNWLTGGPGVKATLPINSNTELMITPGYVTYHDGYFIVPDITADKWYLSAPNNGLSWDWGAGDSYVFGAIQTKPTNAVAVLRAPGRGNLIYVFGTTVTEMWYDNRGQLFPYERSNSVSIDYGCLSATTIATMDNYVCFLGANEKSGPVIMASTGGGFERLSNDGIDFKLDQLINPSLSYAFFFQQNGHVFYQITFYDPRDNTTLLYDFTTQTFSNATDENMNFHIAESIAFYNNTYYFTSLVDGHVYELNELYTNYDYTDPTPNLNPPATPRIYQIPRMRICSPIRLEDSSRFLCNSVEITIEQGGDQYFPQSQFQYICTENGLVLTGETPQGFVGTYLTNEVNVDDYAPRVDFAVSRDGAESFSNFVPYFMNSQSHRANRMIFWRVGVANDLTIQFRFWSLDRVAATNGLVQLRDLNVRKAG